MVPPSANGAPRRKTAAGKHNADALHAPTSFAQLDVLELVARFGPEMTVGSMRAKTVCRMCQLPAQSKPLGI
jgi:hypothetical protein